MTVSSSPPLTFSGCSLKFFFFFFFIVSSCFFLSTTGYPLWVQMIFVPGIQLFCETVSFFRRFFKLRGFSAKNYINFIYFLDKLNWENQVFANENAFWVYCPCIAKTFHASDENDVKCRQLSVGC